MVFAFVEESDSQHVEKMQVCFCPGKAAELSFESIKGCPGKKEKTTKRIQPNQQNRSLQTWKNKVTFGIFRIDKGSGESRCSQLRHARHGYGATSDLQLWAIHGWESNDRKRL